MRIIFFVLLLFSIPIANNARTNPLNILYFTEFSAGEIISTQQIQINDFALGPNPLRKIFFEQKNKNKKITAAVLAFPFPFGIVGLHRIYLGCEPFIPVVYIASLGGAFGILPLIDFLVILKEEDITKFNNSNQVFMWVDH